jgi:predicted nucleic acid-binding protein
MRSIVDCSVALAWVIPDEVTDHSRSILKTVSDKGAIVPSLWKIETANGLLVALRRGRINKQRLLWGISFYERLSIEVDPETLSGLWARTLNLAELNNLTVYDATYLELALRRRLPLATYDQDLRQAAATAGVDLL